MSIITLTTDLGLSDYYVGKLKGYLLSQLPTTQLVDISHAVTSHDISTAAYFVKSAKEAFPPQTIHIINVYTIYGSDSRMLICEQDDSYYIAPDNGVMSLIFPEMNVADVRIIKPNHVTDSLFETIAHACACIANGLIEECSDAALSFTERLSVQPVTGKDEIRGTIIHVDHMENVITNISKEVFEKYRNGRNYEIYFKHNDPITQLSKSYADVPVGEIACLFNDGDMLEIAINMGKASSLHGLHLNETIQIYFV